jgi:hypothetical protein
MMAASQKTPEISFGGSNVPADAFVSDYLHFMDFVLLMVRGNRIASVRISYKFTRGIPDANL